MGNNAGRPKGNERALCDGYGDLVCSVGRDPAWPAGCVAGAVRAVHTSGRGGDKLVAGAWLLRLPMRP